jgi:peptidoglycan/xylan/chitin deacetylase (PgdA/CDA1 family)
MFSGVERAGYKLVGWSWFTFDWVWFRQRTGERVASQIVSHAAPGKIIVIHDGHHIDSRPDRQYTIDAVGLMVPKLRAQGYELGSLCEAVQPKVLKERPEGF